MLSFCAQPEGGAHRAAARSDMRSDHHSSLCLWWPLALSRSRHPVQRPAALGDPAFHLVALPSRSSTPFVLVPWTAAWNNRTPAAVDRVAESCKRVLPLDGDIRGDQHAEERLERTTTARGSLFDRAGSQRLAASDSRWRSSTEGMEPSTEEMRRWARLPSVVHGRVHQRCAPGAD